MKFSKLSIALLLVGLVAFGCNSSQKKKEVKKKKLGPVVSPADKEEIKYLIEVLNNPNRRENNRTRLLELGKKSTAHAPYVTNALADAYNASLKGKMLGLNEAGRARAIYVIGRVQPESETAKALVEKAHSDPALEVKVAAWELDASVGDTTHMSAMLKATETSSEFLSKRICAALMTLAKPDNRDTVVESLNYNNLKVLTPVVDKTLPDLGGVAVLMEMLGDSDRGPVVQYAADALVEARRADAMPKMAAAAKRFDSDTRVVTALNDAIEKLARATGKTDQAAELFAVQAAETENTKNDAAARIIKLKRGAAAPMLTKIIQNSDATKVGRALCLSAAASNAGSFSAARKAEIAVAARSVLGAEVELQEAGVRALGSLGDPTNDADLMYQLCADTDRRARLGVEVSLALLKLGGKSAQRQLVLLMVNYDDLRPKITATMAKLDKSKLPVFLLVELLDHHKVEVRRSSFKILNSAVSDRISFDPEADADLRKSGVEKWREYVERVFKK